MVPTGPNAEHLIIPSDSGQLVFQRSGRWSIGFFAVCWSVAFLWLIVRVAWLLRKPRSHLKEMLGIIEPVIPDVVVDRLGDTWASIYWSYATLSGPNSSAPTSQPTTNTNSVAGSTSVKQRRPKIKQQVVRIGEKLIIVPGDHRRLVISDLVPNKPYKISIYPLYTHQKDPTAVPNVDKDLLAKKMLHIHTLQSETDDILPLNQILVHQPPAIPEKYISHDDYSACAQEVRKIQLETFEACVQYADLESQYQTKQESLDQELVDLHAKRRQDESQRAQLRAENKMLEDDDHALEVQVNKLKLQAAQAAKLRADSEQNLVKVVALNQAQLSERAEFEQQLRQLNSQWQQLQQRELDLQTKIRTISANQQSDNNSGRNIKLLLDKLRNSLSTSSEEKLKLLKSEEAKILGEENRQKIIREIQLDARIDWEWARAQRALEQQYVDAYSRSSQKQPPAMASPSPKTSVGSSSRHNSVSSGTNLGGITGIMKPISPPPPKSPKLTPTSSFISVNSASSHNASTHNVPTHNVPTHSAPAPGRAMPQQLHQPSRSTSSIGSSHLVPSLSQSALNAPSLNTPSLSSPGLPTAQMNGFINHHPYSSTSLLNTKQMNAQLMQSAMQSGNSQHLHSVPSFVSMNSQMSLPSLNRLSSASVQSLNPAPFDAFGINSGGIQAGVPAVPAFSSGNGLPNSMLSTNLGPNLGSNLFQTPIRRSNEYADRDSIFGNRRGHEPRSSMESFSAADFLHPRPPPSLGNYPDSQDTNSGSGTDLAPNASSRRTTSLFFGSKSAPSESTATPDPLPHRDLSNGSSTDTAVEEDTEPVTSRSPRRGMGSRFFHKSSHNNHRSGSFVRRLSIFSRKESEPAEHDEA